MQLGDIVASVATPIARTLELDCIDPETQQLRPESRCNQWRSGLNRFGHKMYDAFWPSKENEQ